MRQVSFMVDSVPFPLLSLVIPAHAGSIAANQRNSASATVGPGTTAGKKSHAKAPMQHAEARSADHRRLLVPSGPGISGGLPANPSTEMAGPVVPPRTGGHRGVGPRGCRPRGAVCRPALRGCNSRPQRGRAPIAARSSLLASLATAACLAVVLTAVIAPSPETASADEAADGDNAFLNNVLSTSADTPGYLAPIPLDEAVEVAGTVYHEDGSPAAGAEVWAAAVYVHPPQREVTRADNRGRFRLHLTPLGGSAARWSVKAFLDDQGGDGGNGYLGRIELLRGVAPSPVVVRLQKRGFVSGHVLAEESGRPLADARLYLGDGRIIVTDASGAYRFGGLPQGNHRMTVVCAGRERRRLTFDNTGRPDTRLDITLPRGAKLRGRVLDEQDRPIAGAAVAFISSGNPLALDGRYVVSDAAGNFVYDGVPEGVPFDGLLWSLPAEFPEATEKTAGPIIFRRHRMEVAAPPDAKTSDKELRGIVRSPAGEPVAGATVKYGATTYEPVQRATTTNDKGELTLQQVPDSDGHVTVIAAGFAPSFTAFKRDKFFAEVRLEPGRSVGGVVRTAKGRPLAGIHVHPYIFLPNPGEAPARSTSVRQRPIERGGLESITCRRRTWFSDFLAPASTRMATASCGTARSTTKSC